MPADLETMARQISDELNKELEWARGRPIRNLDALDAHFDALLKKVATLAEIVAQVAAGNH